MKDFRNFTFHKIHDVEPIALDMLGIDQCSNDKYIYRVNANITVLGYILSGHGCLEINSLIFNLEPGNFFILPKGSSYTIFTKHNQPLDFLYINIMGTFIPSFLEAYQLNTTYWITGINLEAQFRKALQIAAENKENINNLHKDISIVIFEILFEITYYIKENRRLLSPIVYTIKKFIENHVEQNITLEELSKLSGIPTWKIEKVFKDEMGITPHNYLLSKKMRISMNLLANSVLSVKEIAYKLNFADEYYFSNVFKSRVGLSPTSFRKACIANNDPIILKSSKSSLIDLSTAVLGYNGMGTSTDSANMDITLCRFKAKSSNSVSSIKINIADARTGKIKCAIYSDKQALPYHLLAETVELQKPGLGWIRFNLNSPYDLKIDTFYWLAVWNDTNNLRISAVPGGPGRYVFYKYGEWPEIIHNSLENNFLHCMFAE